MLKKTVLRGKRNFSTIYNRGKSVADRYVVVFYKKNGLPYYRTAFLASKKVGNSVARNRARRLMKEGFRLSNLELPQGYDYIFIARNTICEKKCADVMASLQSAIRRTGVLKK